MEKEAAETLAYFRENAADLRKLGKEWGLNEEEINQCIERAMSMDPKDLPKPETTASTATRMKFAARKSWPKLRILLWVVGVVAVLCGAFVMAMENEHVEHRVMQIVQPVLYPVLRALRLAASPLHDMFDMYGYFMSSCFVPNPLFSEETMLEDHICENCDNVSQVTEFTASSFKQGPLPFDALTEPVLVKGKGALVTFDTFQNILSNNPFVKQKMLGVRTNLRWAPQVTDLLEKDAAAKLAAQPDFYFYWLSKQASISQVMRKVFPRPDILGRGSATSIQKQIFLVGPKSKSFQLPGSMMSSFNWYVQGSGLAEVTMTPPKMCGDGCPLVKVTLEPQDILVYNSDIHSAEVAPVGDEMGISFLGSFDPKG